MASMVIDLPADLKPEDWQHWGHFTTFKSNAAELLRKSLRPDQIVYCSPLVDPYQPAESDEALMPGVLDAVIGRHPDAILIAPTDKTQLVAPLKKAADAGIPVITVDTFIGNGQYQTGSEFRSAARDDLLQLQDSEVPPLVAASRHQHECQ